MTPEKQLEQQHAAQLAAQSPGALAVKQIRDEEAKQQRLQLNAEAAKTWRTVDNIKPADYEAAYAEGKPLTDGNIPNRHVPYQGGPGLFGHDPQTGRDVTGEYPDAEGIGELVGSEQNVLDGVQTIRLDDALPLAKAAKSAKDFAEFDKQVPDSWTPEQKTDAWRAKQEHDEITRNAVKLERLNQQPPKLVPAEFTVEDNEAAPEWAAAARTLYKNQWNTDFDGTDKEAAAWMTQHMRWFDNNVAVQSAALWNLSKAGGEELAAWKTVFDRWDKTATEWTISNAVQNFGRAAVDPTNLLGLGFGKATLVTAGKLAAAEIINKAALRAAAKDIAQAATMGAAGGAIGEAHWGASRKILKQEEGLEEGLAGDTARGAVTGAVSTVAINEGLQAAAKLTKSAWSKLTSNNKQTQAEGAIELATARTIADRARGTPTDTPDLSELFDPTLAKGNPRNVLFDQLKAAGRAEDLAAEEANLVGAAYEAIAKQYGITAEELFRLRPFEVQTGSASGKLGSYEPATAVATLLKGANASTFVHEAGHHFLEMLSDLAAGPRAPAVIKADMGKVLDWFGVDEQSWAGMSLDQKRPHHERFAKAFEGYLRDGKAPNNALKRTFAAFKSWLTNIYVTAEALGGEIHPQMRGVFDRLVGGTNAPGPVSLAMVGRVPVHGGRGQGVLYQDEATMRQILQDNLDEDRPMPDKYISTGTINTERHHPGAKLADLAEVDPGAMLALVENSDDLGKLMERIGEGMQLKDGVRSHDEVAKADVLAQLKPILEGKQTGLATDRQLYAMRSMVATLGDQTVDMARRISAGDQSPKLLLQYQQTGMQLIAMQKMLTGNVREVARALSQQRMIATILSKDDIVALERSLQDVSEPGALVRNAQALTKQLENGTDPIEALGKSLKRRTKLEAAVEFWTANILTSPKTHAVNIAANAAFTGWHLAVVKPLAGAIGSTRAALNIGLNERISLSESAASFMAGFRGSLDGLRGMIHVMLTNESQFDTPGAAPGTAAKLENRGALHQQLSDAYGVKGEVAAQVLTPAFRLLKAEDELFKTIAYRAEVEGLAVRGGMMAGLKGEALADFVTKFRENVPDEAHQAAIQKADELTMSDSHMGGGLIGLVGMQARLMTQKLPAMKFILPFITAPTNAIVQGLEASALSIVSPKLWKDINAGGAKADIALAKMASGTALTGLAWVLYDQGYLTGNGPEDPAQRRALEATGWQRNSFVLDGVYYDINRMDPFGAALFSVAGAFDRAKYARRDLDVLKETMGAAAAFGERMLDLPFLTGLKQFMDVFEYGPVGAASMVGSIGSGFVPYSGAFGAVARTGDQDTGTKAFTKPAEAGMGAEGFGMDLVAVASESIAARLPWARDGMRPARYWDGSVIMPTEGSIASAVNPIPGREDRQDQLSEELVANGIGYTESKPALTRGGVTINVLDLDHGEGIVYDQMLVRIGESRRQMVQAVVESGAYENAEPGPGGPRAAMLMGAMNRGKAMGEALFLRDDLPELLESGEIDPNRIAIMLGDDAGAFFRAARGGKVERDASNRFVIKSTGKPIQRSPHF